MAQRPGKRGESSPGKHMKLTFKLRFHTKFGQSLWMTGNHEALGDGQIETAIPLQYLNNDFWQATIVLPDKPRPSLEIRYNYILRLPDGSTIQDCAVGRSINPAGFDQEELLIVDAWNNEGYFENAFYTEPFQRVLLKSNHTEVQGNSSPAATHTFRIKAPLLAEGQTLCLLGDAGALGNWNMARPILLNRTAGRDFLEVKLDLSGQRFPITYKYGIHDVEKGVFIRYEDGNNRILHDGFAPNQHTIVNDGFAVLPVNTWKGAGVAIPVFSLRSENSFGVGEFEDLKLLADWAGEIGLKLIQILPINDTTATHTWTDSYPYAAISAFALHPLYLNLKAVATAKNKKLLVALESERRRLNALETLDYDAVMKAKIGFIRQIFPSQKEATFRDKDYRKFFEDNRHWLEPYAVFCYLRDKCGTSDFNKWPDHRRYEPKEAAEMAAENSPAHDEIALHYFIQYHLHRQLQGAAEYAHRRGVILKGDIAIGVYRHGVDVWQQPELYHLDTQAGAPPDPFSATGQNWGFPTYNWPRMKEDGFTWWKRRFAQMSCYFDAFRIDHILGFFRIWSIPTHAVEGVMGQFVPAIPVDVSEFSARGIEFDHDRFTKPFITDAVLREMFGRESDSIRRQFLTAKSHGHYSLKPEYATQRQVELAWPSAFDLRLKQGLFDLISNVILFEAQGSHRRQYHFRFSMEQTSSFKNVLPHVRTALREMYINYFFRRQDDFWMREAMQKLPALKRVTNMLICGEDLGVVPDCVPVAMKQLGLLGLEIQRMPKRLGQEFSRPADAPYLSVVTPSSHDMSTIRGWWVEDGAMTQKFFNQELGMAGMAPKEATPEIVEAVINQHLASPAMWSIFQLQDLLGMDGKLRHVDVASERINVPAVPNHYWRYRMHLTLERLLQATEFNQELHHHITESGR